MDRLTTQGRTFAVVAGACLLMSKVAPAVEVQGCPISGAGAQQSWDQDCAAAMQMERDPVKKAELHFRRAYVLNERQAYQEALDDLNAACSLLPHTARYLHERAYTLNSLARYPEALVDLNEEASLVPQAPAVYQERALTRTRLGDWQGALADRDQDVKLVPASASALIARAQARLWLGQFEEARADLKAASALATRPPRTEDARYLERVAGLIEAWTQHSSGDHPGANCSRASSNADFSRPTLIGDCTLAFLTAQAPRDKAEALTQRAIAWLVARQSQGDATTDHEAAVALDPGNPDLHTNLGFAYLQERHSWAARQEFDRSMGIRPTYMALAGRAQAHYNLDEKDQASRDAKESIALKPNVPALWVLGDLAKDRQDDAAAKRFWVGAYQLGSRGEALVERLKSVGVMDPGAEPNAELPQ